MSKSKKKPQAKKPAATKYTARKNKRLILSNAARDDIADYIDLCQYEIGGFGYVTINKEGNFYVDEVFLAKQNVTGTTVDFVDAGLSDAIMKAVEAGRNKELMFCWHSHVNMGAFWSGTDETMIAGMNNGMTPYLVSLVQNKSGEHKARVDYYNPGGPLGQHTNQVTFELDLYHESPVDKVPARIKEEFEKQVNVNARTSFGFGYETSMYGGAGWMDEWDDKRKQSHEKPWIEGIDVRLHNRRFIIGERRVKFLLEKIAKTGNQSLTKNEASDLEAINHGRKQQEKAAEKQVEADAGWRVKFSRKTT